MNKLPPILVYANKKASSEVTNTNQKELKVYVNHLRQSFVTSIRLEYQSSDVIPYIVFDSDAEEEQSRRLFKPVVPNMVATYQQSSDMRKGLDGSPILSAAGASVRQALSRSNQTLQQIREASAELMPSPESQLSYKPMTPNGPQLPANLQLTLTRSKQI